MSGPVYTGPLPVQISGDIELGQTYVQSGRKMLGTLLQTTGAAERMARGEPGGYYRKSLRMPDGTLLSVTSNDGHNVLRIDTPRPQSGVGYQSEHHTASGSAPHHTIAPTAEPTEPFDMTPLPTYPTREDGEEGEEPRRQESSPYMWVGIRYLNSGIPWNTPQAIMIEPDSGAGFNDGPPLRGILGTVAYWPNFNLFMQGGGADWAIENSTYGIDNLNDAVQHIYEAWRDRINDDDGHEHAETNIILGTHAIMAWMNNEGVMQVSGNGLRCEALVTMWDNGFTGEWLGYDPLAESQSGAAVRDVGDRHTRRGEPLPLWDAVYTLDPDEDEQVFPCDDRPAMQGMRRALEAFGVKPRVLPGEYILALHSFDTTPHVRSRRAGEVIPLYDTEKDNASGMNRRSASGDYVSFMEPTSSVRDLMVEVEVRLGRGDSETTFRFQATIPESNNDAYACMPYGIDWHEPCHPIGGSNPLGPNFAPAFIAIDVTGGSARWIDHDEADLYPILGGGVYSYPQDNRAPLHIYLCSHPFSVPSAENWPAYAGRALWKVLEAATAGVYGISFLRDPGGEGGCKSIMADTTPAHVWKYDAMAGTLEPVVAHGDINDYPYGWIEDSSMPGGGFQSPYVPEMAWYYPFKYQEWNGCNNSVGIAVSAVYDQFTINNGSQHYFADPPVTTDCC